MRTVEALRAEDIETGVGHLVPGGIVTDDERTRLIIELMSRDDDDSALAAKVLLADLLTMSMLESADPEGSFRLTASEVKDRCGASVPSDAVCLVTQERARPVRNQNDSEDADR